MDGNGSNIEKSTKIMHQIMFVCTDILPEVFRLGFVLLQTTIEQDGKAYHLPGVNLTQIREGRNCADGENLLECMAPSQHEQSIGGEEAEEEDEFSDGVDLDSITTDNLTEADTDEQIERYSQYKLRQQ